MALIASDQKFTGRAGDFFQQTVSCEGVVDYWSASGLPEGLSINNQSGVISGTPKSAGRFVATVTAETRATQVAAGYLHSLALLRDGTVMSWGRLAALSRQKKEAREQGLLEKPPDWRTHWMSRYVETPTGISDVVAVAAGVSHALALKGNGTVVAWGSNAGGQCSVPSGLSNVVEISAGHEHSLARRSDGTIVGWGEGVGKIPTPPVGYSAAGIKAGKHASLAHYENTQNIAGTVYSESSHTRREGYWSENDGSFRSYGVPIGNGVVPYAVTGSAATSVFTAPGHNYVENQAVIFTKFSGGNGIIPQFVYFVRNISGNNFQLSRTRGGEVTKFVINMTAGSIIAIQANVAVSKSNIRGIPRFVLGWEEDPEIAVKRTGGRVADFEGNPMIKQRATLRETDAWSWHSDGDGLNVFRVYDEVQPGEFGGWRYFVHEGSEVGMWDAKQSSAAVFSRAAKGFVGGESGLLTTFQTKRSGYWIPHDFRSLPDYYEISYNLRSEGYPRGSYIVVEKRSPIRLLAVGDEFFIVLRGDGKMVAWGNNRYGQLDIPKELNGTSLYRLGAAPTVRVPYDPLIQISAGYSHCLALVAEGWVVGWGQDNYDAIKFPGAEIEFQIAGAIDIISTAEGVARVGVILGEAPKLLFSCEFICAANAQAIFSNPTFRAEVHVSATLEGALAIRMGFAASANGVAIATGVLDFSPVPTLVANAQGVCALEGVVAIGIEFVAAAASGVASATGVLDFSPVSTLVANAQGVCALEGVVAIGMEFVAAASGVASATGVLDFSPVPTLVANIRTPRATTKISAGNFYSLALKNDGTVVGWGQNDYGQATSPAGLSGVIAVAAGRLHSLALKNDGTVVAWGYNVQGQTTIPAGISGVIAVAAGGFHSLALKNDGTVVAWGSNNWGQRTIPAGLSGVIAVAAGYDYSLALKNNGTVVGWGRNDDGLTSIPSWISGVIAIAAGPFHSLALKNDGTVEGWGDNTYGQATSPAGLSGVIAVAAGHSHSLALKNNGTVVAWGQNDYGQATSPAGLSDVIAISSGYHYSLALKNGGTVVAWGSNGSGETTIPSELERDRLFCALEGVVAIGMEFVVAASGVASATGVLDFAPVPTLVANAQAFSYVDISIGGARYIVLVQDLYASSTLEGAMVMTLNLARN